MLVISKQILQTYLDILS